MKCAHLLISIGDQVDITKLVTTAKKTAIKVIPESTNGLNYNHYYNYHTCIHAYINA